METQNTNFNQQQFKNDQLELENTKMKMAASLPEYSDLLGKKKIMKSTIALTEHILNDLKSAASKEQLIKKLMDRYDDVEKQKFVMQNILEAIKRRGFR